MLLEKRQLLRLGLTRSERIKRADNRAQVVMEKKQKAKVMVLPMASNRKEEVLSQFHSLVRLDGKNSSNDGMVPNTAKEIHSGKSMEKSSAFDSVEFVIVM